MFDPPQIDVEDTPQHDGDTDKADSPQAVETEVEPISTSTPLTQANRYDCSSSDPDVTGAVRFQSNSDSPMESDNESDGDRRRGRPQRQKRQPLWMRKGDFQINQMVSLPSNSPQWERKAAFVLAMKSFLHIPRVCQTIISILDF